MHNHFANHMPMPPIHPDNYNCYPMPINIQNEQDDFALTQKYDYDHRITNPLS